MAQADQAKKTKRCKSCNGCRALYCDHGSGYPHCELGFEIRVEHKKIRIGSFEDTMPVGYPIDPNCPKPRTVKALIEYGLSHSGGARR